MASHYWSVFSKKSPAPLFSRWARRGAVALEFAILAFPFFLWLLFIFELSYDLFTQEALDGALQAAVRQIQTGNAQGVKIWPAVVPSSATYLCPARQKGLLECNNMSDQRHRRSTGAQDFSNITHGCRAYERGHRQSVELTPISTMVVRYPCSSQPTAPNGDFCNAQASQAICDWSRHVYIGPSFIGRHAAWRAVGQISWYHRAPNTCRTDRIRRTEAFTVANYTEQHNGCAKMQLMHASGTAYCGRCRWLDVFRLAPRCRSREPRVRASLAPVMVHSGHWRYTIISKVAILVGTDLECLTQHCRVGEYDGARPTMSTARIAIDQWSQVTSGAVGLYWRACAMAARRDRDARREPRQRGSSPAYAAVLTSVNYSYTAPAPGCTSNCGLPRPRCRVEQGLSVFLGSILPPTCVLRPCGSAYRLRNSSDRDQPGKPAKFFRVRVLASAIADPAAEQAFHGIGPVSRWRT